MNQDTRLFNAAFNEFMESNPQLIGMKFWDLSLDNRCAILRVAQLKKDELKGK